MIALNIDSSKNHEKMEFGSAPRLASPTISIKEAISGVKSVGLHQITDSFQIIKDAHNVKESS
jgi:hypothetical protein